MSLTQVESKQLDAEIMLCIKNEGPMTGYAVVHSIAAPPMTVRYKLKRMVEAGVLDCEDRGRAKVYRIPEKLLKTLRHGNPMPKKLYSSGRPRRGKSMAAIAMEGNEKKVTDRPKLGKTASELAAEEQHGKER